MSNNETVKEKFMRGLGKNYISEEKYKKMQDDIRTGRKIVISYDDSYAPYHPPVTLEESKFNLRKLVETMKKEEQCGRIANWYKCHMVSNV